MRAQAPRVLPGKYAVVLEKLPNDIGALVRIVQSVEDLYGFAVPDGRKGESHIR